MGIIQLDENEASLTLFANLYFYGNAANEMLAGTIAADINQYWTIPEGHAQIRSKRYKVLFNTKGFFSPNLTEEEVNENTDPLNNYFRIEEFASGNISFVDGINSNTGYFKLDNLLNNSTTAAHEFGHTLGLLHPEDLDLRGRGVPGIMYPRGTITDATFQYDLHAAPGAIGGTMNPFHRRVLQEDIDDLHLGKLKFNEKGQAIIGAFTSEWHLPHNSML